jgi:hypothetical protein
MDIYELLKRLQFLAGFELEAQVMEEIRNPVDPFEIVAADIKSLPEKTTHVNIVAYLFFRT